MIRTTALTAISLFAGPMTTCHAQTALDLAQGGIEAFTSKSAGSQKKLLTKMRAAADEAEGAHFDSMRALLADVRAAKRVHQKSKLGKTKKARKRAPDAIATWQLPTLVTYRYGLTCIEPVLQSGGRTAQQRAQRRAPAELLLLGMLPDADLIMADLQARMDHARSADGFMRFLELWRNGDESFYEALDRTAGTEDSVFFYDVMLGDYVNEFGKGKTEAAKQLAKSLDAAHDALHESFLSYRQYRAFREAVALSMVLPPDVPLPKQLQRYESKAQGLYSLRQQVMMVLAVNGYDPRTVAKLIAESAPPLPDPLWSAGYDPYPAWSAVFQRAMPEMIAASGDTTKFLESVEQRLIAGAERLRLEVRAVLGLSSSSG